MTNLGDTPLPASALRGPQVLLRWTVLPGTAFVVFLAYGALVAAPFSVALSRASGAIPLLPIVLASTLNALLVAALAGLGAAAAMPRHARLASLGCVAPTLVFLAPALLQPVRPLTRALMAYDLAMLLLCPLAAAQALAARLGREPARIHRWLHAPWSPVASYAALFAWLYVGAIIVSAFLLGSPRPGPMAISLLVGASITLAAAVTAAVFARRHRRALSLPESRQLLVRCVVAAGVIQGVQSLLTRSSAPWPQLAALSAISLLASAALLAGLYALSRRWGRPSGSPGQS